MKGGTSGNCSITINKDFIQKNYKKSGHNAFINELYFYLLGKELNLEFIPELLDYNVSKRMLKIKNVGKSLHELYKGKMDEKRAMIPKVMEEYKKLVKLGFYHNDLRYKNIVYNEREEQIYLIDFEFTSTKFLDKDDEHIIKPLKTIKSNNKRSNNKRSNNNKRSKKKRSNKHSISSRKKSGKKSRKKSGKKSRNKK
jgi:RIO-like serine/threonine protein kinase